MSVRRVFAWKNTDRVEGLRGSTLTTWFRRKNLLTLALLFERLGAHTEHN